MKTKHQKRSEALKRRSGDYDKVTRAIALWQRTQETHADECLYYGRYLLLNLHGPCKGGYVEGAIVDAKESGLKVVEGPEVFGFLSRKLAHAACDMIDLKAKLA